MFIQALLSLTNLAGAPGSWIAIAMPIASTVLAIGLFFGLLRLGLLSSDRVRHGSVIEAMCDGVLAVDMNDRLVEFNDAAREVLELDDGALFLRHLADVLAQPPDLVELFGGAIDGFEFFSAERATTPESTIEMLEHVGELIGRAVERKLVQEKIRRLAFRDDLTGLPNRQRFHHLLNNAVSHARRAERKMALLFMDLDGFKKVNDTLGHQVGDRLLAEVASRFSGVVRVSDHVGRRHGNEQGASISRLGGDEFTLLLTEIQEPADAALVASRLLETLEHPVLLGGQKLFMSTSIGVAVYPEDGTD
jgi:diguanylate cyclase (GGDEF)-like protein